MVFSEYTLKPFRTKFVNYVNAVINKFTYFQRLAYMIVLFELK